MLLSEHTYCVAIAFKMTEWVEQWICIKVCVQRKHSSTETIGMIQKATAMGNGWLAASSRQRTRSCIMSCTVFLWNIKSLRWLSPLQSRFGALWLLAFPKIKITFEREEISDLKFWDSGKHDRVTDGNWENCVRSQGAFFEGDWGIIVLCSMFLLSCIVFNKCLYFS